MLGEQGSRAVEGHSPGERPGRARSPDDDVNFDTMGLLPTQLVENVPFGPALREPCHHVQDAH